MLILSVIAVEERRERMAVWVWCWSQVTVRLLWGVRWPRSAANIGMKPTSPGLSCGSYWLLREAASSPPAPAECHAAQLPTLGPTYSISYQHLHCTTILYGKAREFPIVVDCSHLSSLVLSSESKLSSCWKFCRCNYWDRKWARLTKSVKLELLELLSDYIKS